MKIICVGWNYKAHNSEMGRVELPSVPTIFMKPDTSLLRENKPFFLPGFSEQIEYEVELVVKINRIGRNIQEKFAHRYYDEIALGVDFTARDLQSKLRSKGQPWEISKAFDGSAVISEFVQLGDRNIQDLTFSLEQNGEVRQCTNTKSMIFSVDKIIEYVSKYFTLKIGDLIYTGTPSGVGAVAIEDRIEGYLEGEKMFDFKVK